MSDHQSAVIHELPALEEKLKVLIRENLLETAPEFTLDSDLYEAGLDSMAIMQLLILIENHFDLMLDEADLSRENFTNIRSLARLIGERQKADRE